MIIRHVKIGLMVIGAWPGRRATKAFVCIIIAIVIMLLFQISNITTAYDELDSLMNNLGTTMPMTSVLLKLLMFRLKFGKVRFIIREMLDDGESARGMRWNVMKQNAKLAVKLSTVIAICYNGLILSYLGLALISYNSESIEDRQFVMQANFPINAKRSPIFEIICVVQFMVAFSGANGHAVMEGLLTTLVLHANTKAYGVCEEISTFSKLCQTSNCRKDISIAKEKLIRKHLNYIYFIENIQDVYAYVAFFHLLLMTLINCTVGFMLITLTSINQDNLVTFLICIAYMFTALSAVGSYCIAGEYLTAQGNWIFEELCSVPWYNFQTTDIKALAFMIMRSRKPVTITFGNFCNLSLIYFTQILKTSGSYLSLVHASMGSD